ncbi:MAG: hypothetical protein V4550_02240 [Gemmatimonadota bacterium]
MKRRDFLRHGLVSAAVVRGLAWPPRAARNVVFVIEPGDPVADAPPVKVALALLEQQLIAVGATVSTVSAINESAKGDLCLVIGGKESATARAVLRSARATAPTAAEGLVLAGTTMSGRSAIVACGADARGLSYALRELADSVEHGTPAVSALRISRPIAQQPANAVRSVMRQFTSEPLDKPWYNDRDGWTRYLDMLATHRFNRLHLAFGLGYDTLSRVTDSYMVFLYPFLLSVPGYPVRATNLPDAERDRNLEMLRFASEQAVARGLDFQLGIWMHGYAMPNSPGAKYVIEGLTAETHAPYCRDALTAVLKACPAISAVALRIHGESGIAEGSYEFWGTVFDGVPRAGRQVEIDLHAKGIDTTMISRASKTGMPINLSPKFAAEHCGMPYHQAAIRDLEMPVAGHTGAGLMTLSEGQRVFTRYGYADLMRDDRAYTVRTRVFAGTQRLLAWGDPEWAAEYSRAFQFAGMTGADLMEPLTCRGRRGTGVGRRDGYADATLAPARDWEKYSAWYRAWGRTMYDPRTAPDVFSRSFGSDARSRALASALARANRILPIVTNAHLPSAACDAYWPEIYWNHRIVGDTPRNPYGDSPSPKNFQHVSPLDPQLFTSISEHAEELAAGARSGKYSPIDVAQWLEDLATRADADLGRAGSGTSPDRRRIAVDVGIQIGLGRFFAAKLRSGVLYALFERTGDRRALVEALALYRRAQAAWSAMSEQQRGVYQADLSVSDKISEHGQWADRLPLIEQDVQQMEQKLSAAATTDHPRVPAAIAEAKSVVRRTTAVVTHTPPARFTPGSGVVITVAVPNRKASSARLYYRHVNQAERYEVVEMTAHGTNYSASIPGAYTDSPYPLQYYFEIRESPAMAWLAPSFGPDLGNQPYYVLRRV